MKSTSGKREVENVNLQKTDLPELKIQLQNHVSIRVLPERILAAFCDERYSDRRYFKRISLLSQ